MSTALITLLITSVGIPTLIMLFTKFVDKDKVAGLLDKAFIALEKLLATLLIRYSQKTVDEVEQTGLGTFYYALAMSGQRGLDRLHNLTQHDPK